MFGHHVLRREQRLPAPPAEVFPFFAEAGNLEAITPPWLRFAIVPPRPADLRAGTLIEYRLRLHGVRVSWLTRIEEWVPASDSSTRSCAAPTRCGITRTSSRPTARARTLMRDTVRYALPYGPFGEVARRLFVARDLAAIFDYRTERVRAAFTRP